MLPYLWPTSGHNSSMVIFLRRTSADKRQVLEITVQKLNKAKTTPREVVDYVCSLEKAIEATKLVAQNGKTVRQIPMVLITDLRTMLKDWAAEFIQMHKK